MKTLIQIAVVALIVGGISAGGSFYMLKQAEKELAAKKEAEKKAESIAQANAQPEPAPMAEGSLIEPDLSDADTLGAISVKPKAPPQPYIDALLSEPPVGVRPPYVPESDEAGKLINKLRSRELATTTQEKRLQQRQEVMDMILDDLRVEQTKSAQVHLRFLEATNLSLKSATEARLAADKERGDIRDQRIAINRNAEEQVDELRRKTEEQIQAMRRSAEEQGMMLRRERDQMAKTSEEAMQTARAERDAAEKAADELRAEREELRKKLDEMTRPVTVQDTSGTPEKTANLKKIAALYDGMPAEKTAKLFMEMVMKGRTEGVVVILDAMKERIAAKVMTSITESDPELAADLSERLKQLKRKK